LSCDMPDNAFVVHDWLTEAKAYEIGLSKRLFYAAARPLSDRAIQRHVAGLAVPRYASRIISERGYHVPFRRDWASSGIDMASTTVLVQGTGTGWDLIRWAVLRPKAIVAVDCFEFESWGQIATYCRNEFGVTVDFIQGSLEHLPEFADESIDLVVSDAVYEHCTNLTAVMAETRRLLKTGGRVYAAYGPLWYCASGDHFSGRDCLESSYNHLVLGESEYADYVKRHTHDHENIQDGVRYIHLNLFSRMTTEEYTAAFIAQGFSVDDLWLEISARAIAYRRAFPDKYRQILAKCGISEIDGLIKTHLLRMHKR